MSAEPGPSPSALPPLRDLPAQVRTRVVALTARVLPDVTNPPAALRKVAEFAPARRARHGATAMVAALETGEEFRERVGTLVAALADADGGPADRGAVLWLVRPDGAAEALGRALDDLASTRDDDAGWTTRVEALTDRVRALEQAERDVRARHRTQLDKLKEQNAELRRRLGETRAAERSARERADRLDRESASASASAIAVSSAAEAEARRLRGQAEELRASLQRVRSAGRAERHDATLRARLLLDTVLDAAAGLRRELALPSADGAPADRVEAGRAEEGVRSPVAGLAATSATLLEQYLALPRVHLIVDGYNVSKSVWGSSSLELQRTRLLSALAALVARTRAEATVVFDASAAGPRPVVTTPRGVRVVFSPAGVIADDVIRDYVAAEPAGRVVVVVTSDQEVARDVVRDGARAVAAGALIGVLQR